VPFTAADVTPDLLRALRNDNPPRIDARTFADAMSGDAAALERVAELVRRRDAANLARLEASAPARIKG
jgi:hypothetical protein